MPINENSGKPLGVATKVTMTSVASAAVKASGALTRAKTMDLAAGRTHMGTNEKKEVIKNRNIQMLKARSTHTTARKTSKRMRETFSIRQRSFSKIIGENSNNLKRTSRKRTQASKTR